MKTFAFVISDYRVSNIFRMGLKFSRRDKNLLGGDKHPTLVESETVKCIWSNTWHIAIEVFCIATGVLCT